METYAHRHLAAWNEAVATLNAEGWQAELYTMAAPVQVEGRLPTGEPFYFRSRNHEARLAIGGDDPVEFPDWERCVEQADASWLPAEDGLAILRGLAARYRAETKPGEGSHN
ncbi:hypothetical protein Val02_61270 [Virgisporangium aliadipatigenens]|uniref:Uncharacterized protein n=1 Tax=Virgisporangium aliadipatigenens TaxID=741659 RepID=A0A8J4DTG1_9ACTN|nr:hypothetical protein [Virgisporangium aliadipatigenens]GIJ49241.1 hypothetical protein Val02_61270 [Virgisporangium aliadipatigenens]